MQITGKTEHTCSMHAVDLTLDQTLAICRKQRFVVHDLHAARVAAGIILSEIREGKTVVNTFNLGFNQHKPVEMLARVLIISGYLPLLLIGFNRNLGTIDS